MDDVTENPDQSGADHPFIRPRFLALGDSYTIGESVPEVDRWPNQLAQLLRKTNPPLELPCIIARTGWTTSELLEGIRQAAPSGTFDLVSLLIGVNNQYRGLDLQDYATELDELLELAIQLAESIPSHVVVLSIPDWSVTPFSAGRDRADIADKIDRFNECKQQRVRHHGCRYVDITSCSRQAADTPQLLADDGLHPSASMYAAWCKLVLPDAQEILDSAKRGRTRGPRRQEQRHTR